MAENVNMSKDPYKEIYEKQKVLLETELPVPEYKDTFLEEKWITMSDGVKLQTSVCRPAADGKWPAVIIRNPYIAADTLYDTVTLPILAEHGYAGVFVRVRATGKSGGEWDPFQNERKDGMEVLDWVASQEWCDGNIGTFGASYVGHVQLCMADYDHPALKTMFVSVYGSKPYELFYRRGMFRPDPWSDWAATMVEDNRHIPFFEKEFHDWSYACSPQSSLGMKLKGRDCNWFNDWIRNTKPSDPYWNEGIWKDLNDAVTKVKIPIFFHCGWYDIFLRSELAGFRELPEEVRKKSRVVIGPWVHPGFAAADALEYPDENKVGTNQMKAALEWFDLYLKGKSYPEKLGVVEAYSIRDNKWRVFEGDIKADKRKILYLDAEGDTCGQLCGSAPAGEAKIEYDYDPENPTHTCGGSIFSSAAGDDGRYYCSLIQPEIHEREGVISFVTDTLEEDLHIAGSVKADIYVSSTAAATSFAVMLMEVMPDGRSVNIRDDITDIRWRTEKSIENYAPGDTVLLELEMTDCVWMLKAGSKLRLDITSSNYPAYHVHPNTEEPWADTVEKVTARQTVYCGGSHASRIELPLLND